MDDQLLYQIALTLIPGVGDVNGKKLVAYCGGPQAVFREKKKLLEKIPGIGSYVIQSILQFKDFIRVEAELEFIKKNNIQPLFYLHPEYPKRLQHCADSPMMLYYKGNATLNHHRIIGIVGTRHPTEYGKHYCEQLVESLRHDDLHIVSGLAYGIDTCAHRASYQNNIPTIGVLGHGLDRIYPAVNRSLASRMLDNGGLLTEFMSRTQPDRENFPRRNRIIAGMVDALIVVESAKKGGALITANIANSYNRDVFAVPGRVGDIYSEGCNYLIRTNQAELLENAKNLRYIMGWEKTVKASGHQTKLFREFTEEEQLIMNFFENQNECRLDDIMINSGFSASKLASLLLTLEFDGIVTALPGKRYKKN
ncbi:MAG: DNA-processing protein DprA [Bacteroidales bacterium]|nr:DNA-processing protein DprA [Bacteroidales bacterium]